LKILNPINFTKNLLLKMSKGTAYDFDLQDIKFFSEAERFLHVRILFDTVVTRYSNYNPYTYNHGEAVEDFEGILYMFDIRCIKVTVWDQRLVVHIIHDSEVIKKQDDIIPEFSHISVTPKKECICNSGCLMPCPVHNQSCCNQWNGGLVTGERGWPIKRYCYSHYPKPCSCDVSKSPWSPT